MLLQRLLTGDQAALGKLKDARCEQCAYPRKVRGQWVQDLVQSVLVLEQVRSPKIAFNVFIGVCAGHYSPALAKAYKEHGWRVRWRAK
jgi:hypothetical protein